MKDLLKEAIADAKAVRQTALANAKMALEEAFTPRLQSMLSAKLAEEMSEEDEEMPAEEEMPTEGEEMDMEEEMPEEEPEMEEGEEMPEEEPTMEGEMEGEEDDLDLEEIIRELEGDEEPAMEEPAMEEDNSMSDDDITEDEEINIEEIIRSLREEDEEQELPEEEETEEVPAEELEEAYNVIRFLKGKINEVNLLNAKLLYSNKLFRNFSLNEGQKMKVIENFDRAFTLREVKLVYSTLAEGFKMPSTRKVVKESFASKPIASTKPARQIISEGTELANRFKKLAGLK